MAAIATADDVALVRKYLPPDATTNGWDDAEIAIRWTGGVVSTLRMYWFERVTDTAGYLDIHDSGGTLPITQIHRQAVEMLAIIDAYLAKYGDVLEFFGSRRTRVGKIKKRYANKSTWMPRSYPSTYTPYNPTD